MSEFRLGIFAEFVERGLNTPAEARRARWSVHRAEWGASYIIGITVLTAGSLRGVLEKMPRDLIPAAVLLFVGLPLLILAMRAWAPRFAHDRIRLQIAHILESLKEVDGIESEQQFRVRRGNPARIQQIHIRKLRGYLRHAAATIPDQFMSISGRGHLQGDTVLRDKLKTRLLLSLAAAPDLSKSVARDDLRELLSVISRVVVEADPCAELEATLRGSPTSCSAAQQPLKTWAWRWATFTIPTLISVLAIPVMAFIAAKLASATTPVGMGIAAAGTAAHAAVKYLQYRKIE
ncbi:hypothetical protein [Amycolatopsis sp. WAC 04197]|uniref:hypothetical protein n=1 Tax=Amycolatopsis sp. WAC 04197 TaxID=2203199 RepID=UPI000F77392E|nr:hypothetical protein [Amycolatopsis sp. WAC 04197]